MRASELFLGLLAVVSLGYAYVVTQKVDRVAKRLDTTVDDISRNVEVEVPESVVNEAVQVAADRAARLAVKEATNSVVNDMKKDIRKEVQEHVKEASNDISSKVADEVRRQVHNIDISALKREVISEGKELAVSKLNSDIDDILKKFNDELSHISKIYGSIADSMTNKNKDTGTILRLG